MRETLPALRAFGPRKVHWTFRRTGLTPERRRQAVYAVARSTNSANAAPAGSSAARGTQRYVPTLKPDEDELTRNIVSDRLGAWLLWLRRVTALPNEQRHAVGKVSVQRLWRRRGAESAAETAQAFPSRLSADTPSARDRIRSTTSW